MRPPASRRPLTAPARIAAVALGVAAAAGAVAAVQKPPDLADPPKALSAAAALPPMASGDGVVFGRVTEADSNRAVPGALVTLTIPGAAPRRVLADGEGRFGFRALPSGKFELTTSRAGWADGAHGRTRPAGPAVSLSLTDGKRVSDIIVPMWRRAAIAGTVRDESGEPVVGVPVRVLRRELVGGQVQLTPGAQDMTDDRGAYRISSLDPGEYIVVVPRQQNMSSAGDDKSAVVSAKAAVAAGQFAKEDAAALVGAATAPTFSGNVVGFDENGRPLIFPSTFYPNAGAASMAGVIALRSGEAAQAIDFTLRAVPTSTVSGRMIGPGGPISGAKVNMAPAEADEMGSTIEWSTAFTDGQGRFTLADVPPGRYLLRSVDRARSTPSASAPSVLWAQMSLTVETDDLAGLTVDLRPGIRTSGMVHFTGGAAQPAPAKVAAIRVVLEPADVRPGLTGDKGEVDASGRFSTGGVAAGRYFLRVAGAPAGWTLHSAMVSGRDASVVPVELESSDVGNVVITFTDRPTELSGRVTRPAGLVEPVTVLVFPTDERAWTGYGSASRRLAAARADASGSFRVQGLPAGEYYAVAIPDRLAADWQHPSTLASLATGAERARLRDGERATVTVKVIR